jgi:hypothetical protein
MADGSHRQGRRRAATGGTPVRVNEISRTLIVFALTALAGVPAAQAEPAQAAVERVVSDYIGLYAGPTLDRWKTLFHPAVVVAFPAEDGAITTRSLDEFFERQRDYFATGRKISERLENVRVDLGRRIARVSADFIFVDEGEELPGKLGLHLVEGSGGWKIVAVLFAYDAE